MTETLFVEWLWSVLKIGGFFALEVLLLALIPRRVWCRMGFHKWDAPGGDCVDCGAHDDFFDR